MTAFRLIQDSCCCDSASAAMQPVDRTEWNVPEQCHGVPLHPRALKQWESKLSFYNIIMHNRKGLQQTCISRSMNEEAMWLTCSRTDVSTWKNILKPSNSECISTKDPHLVFGESGPLLLQHVDHLHPISESWPKNHPPALVHMW